MSFNDAPAWVFLKPLDTGRLVAKAPSKRAQARMLTDEINEELEIMLDEPLGPETIAGKWIAVKKCIQREDGYRVSFERIQGSKLQKWDLVLNPGSRKGSYEETEPGLRRRGEITEISSPHNDYSRLFTSYFQFLSIGSFHGQDSTIKERESCAWKLGILRPTPEESLA